MNKTGWLLAGVSVVIIVAAVAIFIAPAKTQAPTINGGTGTTTTPVELPIAQIPDVIVVDSITNGSKVASPLTVAGKARGPWYFEASFPIELLDAQGKAIAQVPAQAQGSWQTTEFVPFSAALTFTAQPSGSKGTLILRKDNPSGLPQNDQSLVIPVVFK